MSDKHIVRKLAYYSGDRVAFKGNLYRVCMEGIDAVLGDHATVKDYIEVHADHRATLYNNGKLLTYVGLAWSRDDEPSYVNQSKLAKEKKPMSEKSDTPAHVIEDSVASSISHVPVHKGTAELVGKGYGGLGESERYAVWDFRVLRDPPTQATQFPIQEVQEVTYEEIKFKGELLESNDMIVFTVDDTVSINTRNIDICLDKAKIHSTDGKPIVFIMNTGICEHKKLGGFVRITTHKDIVVKDGIFKINLSEFDVYPPHGQIKFVDIYAVRIK